MSTELGQTSLSAAEFRSYNKMAQEMDSFHQHFRTSWETLYSAASSGSRPPGLSLRQFLTTGLRFCHILELHHSLEEQYVFPYLAKRMPAFRTELELLAQHKQIHAGLDTLNAYLEECAEAKRELRLTELRMLMDSFGGVLFAHLDDEVAQLGAENMRRFWSVEEVQGMPECFGMGW